MSWRDRIRARIHEDLSSEAILRCQNDAGFFIPEIGLSRPDRFSQFDIVGSVSHIETRELCLRTAKGSIASMTRCDATRLSMLLDAAAESVPLIEIGKIDYAKINLDLAANQGHKVSFDVIRPEPNYKIGATTTSRVGASCGPRIQPPDPPKEFEGMSLEDRLRVMLAPPIYESLRDPDLGLPFPPYPFQAYGIKWLLDRSSGLLADEMGLGKTMQAVLAARLLWRERKIEQVLIICPKSLISTWKAEIRKWWPSARDSTHEPAGDRRFFLRLATSGMVIKLINYEAIARESEWLAEQKWSHDLVIIDEAQRIKNAATDVARAVKALKGTRKWALTGTPLENRVRDVVSIFEFLDSKILSSEEPDHVRDRIRPYMLRRRTEEVIKDLPEKDDREVEIELGDRQRRLYDEIEGKRVQALNDLGESVTVGSVFALISELMQVCNFHLESGESAKLDRIKADLDEVMESGKKALIFSRFVNKEYGIARIKQFLPESYGIVEMHGSIPQAERDRNVDLFNGNSEAKLFLLSYRVGNAGLNLQAANYVFLFDRWWNPAVEEQATKRAHRIGQKNKVFVRRLYCKDTIEERILRKLNEKRRLFAMVIDDANPCAADLGLTEEELFSLFGDLKARPKHVRRVVEKPRIVLDELDSKQFENLVAVLYERLGYSVSVSGGPGDRGTDVLAEKSSATGGERISIQCKHTKSTVGQPVVQHLWGALNSDDSLTRGVIVSSSTFSADAKSFVAGIRITLIDRKKLIELLMEFGVVDLVDDR